MTNWQIKIKEILPETKEYVPLKEHTTLGVGGPGEFFISAKSIEQLVQAIAAARKTGAPYRVIGNGSNIICSDKGFNGLIISNETSNLQIDEATGRVICDGGVALSRVILEAASHGLGGFEPLYGIPGTVGGAVVVNAGAHGVDVARYLQSSSVMVSSEKILNVKNDWFEFKYRESKLKHKHDSAPPVILNAIFQFQRRKKDDILIDIAKFKKERQQKQPIGFKTCGSIFKNPAGTDAAQGDEIAKTAGYLLDESGAKKFHSDGMHVAKIHANWIINTGTGSATDARKLIEKMRQSVEEKFQVTLVEEVEYVGDWDEIQEK